MSCRKFADKDKTAVHWLNPAGRICIQLLVILLMMPCQACLAGSIQTDFSSGRIIRVENIRDSILHMQNLGNRSTWQKQWEAARWLEGRLRASGLLVYIDRYKFKDKAWPNVIGEIKGNTHPDQKILLIAHLDSISDSPSSDGAPGADDNGSGVAVILEIARVLRNMPLNRSIMFCIFSNEEQGQIGSSAFANQAKRHGKDLRAVINADVLGYGRPRYPFYPGVVMSQKNWKDRLRAIKWMGMDFIQGFFCKGNAITVNGRPANTGLVKIVAHALASNSALLVKERVKSDCG